MSHIKNVDSFEKLLAVCTGYGGEYNHGQQNLRLEYLSALLGNARAALRQAGEARVAFENVTNSREVAFDKMAKLITRIVGELKASDAGQTVIEVRSIVRRMSGRRLSDRAPVSSGNAEAVANEDRTRTGGRDFATKEYYFGQLLQVLASEPLYQPHVEDLKIPNLINRLASLRNENAKVAHAAAALNRARRERNAVFYHNQHNLYSTALAVKEEVKAIYGYGVDAHRAVSHIPFKKPV
jgi:hypothetical protein